MMANQSGLQTQGSPRVTEPHVIEHLTPRETEVLQLVADGYSTKEIAARLQISFKTAACHRTRIMSKFGACNGVMLVRLAIREGFVQA